MGRIEVRGNRIIGHFAKGERVTDAELYEMGREAGMGPAFFEGLAEGIAARESGRSTDGSRH